MAGYQSPKMGLGGMPQAPSRMNMAGYSSPMAASPGRPTGNYDPLGSMRAPQAPAAARDNYDPLGSVQAPSPAGKPNPSGYSFGPGPSSYDPLSSVAPPQPPNMDMAGYRSPMTGLTGMPPAPGQMNMADYQSPMAAATGGLPVAQSGNRPRALGLENYQGPSPVDPPQVADNPPGQPPGPPMDLTQVQQQQATLIGVLKEIMSRGGPKNETEQKLVLKIARALQATGAGGNMDYTLTEAAI
jgi:hypothetical protein